MKHILLLSLLVTTLVAKSQVFWTENFNNWCTSNCLAASYNGPAGAWTVTSTGTNAATGSNLWYVSCAENGEPAGSCGASCGGSGTLHMASSFIVVDPGAAYNANKESNYRAESPTINCSGKTNISLAFNYIEGGETTLDNATVWYYDGSSWAQLSDPAKTATICPGGQGLWTAYSVALPASANNNANVKIGFNWTNNTTGGSDPSFAVDSIAISGTAAGGAPVAAFTVSDDSICVGTCLTFTDQSSNSPTSWSWAFPGATPSSSAIQNPSFVCYTVAGTYTVTLTATNGSGSDTQTHVIVVHPLPHPTLIVNSPNISCPNGSLYTNRQWYRNGSILTGYTNTNITAPSNGTYYIRVTDSNGCTGNSDTVTITGVAVQNINSAGSGISLYPNPNNGTFTLTGTIGYYDNDASVVIMDVTGRVVLQNNIEVSGGMLNKEIVLDAAVSKGMYMLILKTGSRKIILPFRKD